ncbi:DUF4291 domain-containing protein [Flexithrix dorotheae]|uniref:DUF4291 domain-containing protein n=1 Tax=Flexithrix dorotheae TaxID=70993 RepID=UPI000362A0A7|nr:DUF4291 domain-containing protein [Flexithrix dorotheae]
MNLETIPYSRYERGLPQKGNWILGQETGDSIIVYQAFNDQIADYAVSNQKFGGNSYSFSRMTWIKPNFLWMMYRAGWATKPNQERILAIKMSKEGFCDLLKEGVYSSFKNKKYTNKESWKEKLAKSEVRIQWDPDHNPHGDKLERRAIQIGIKGEKLKKFNSDYIKKIIDITSFVKKQKENLEGDKDNFFVINESIVEIGATLKSKFSIKENFISEEIQNLQLTYLNNGEISDHDFEQLLLDGKLRNEFIDFIKNYRNENFSRFLLRKAIDYRKSGNDIMCEDLLMFSYFASKNKSSQDLDLIMEAKLADFDTWCGFDAEMVFYPLGFEKTIEYLNQNKEKFEEKPVEYYSNNFSKEYLNNDIHNRAFWYLY